MPITDRVAEIILLYQSTSFFVGSPQLNSIYNQKVFKNKFIKFISIQSSINLNLYLKLFYLIHHCSRMAPSASIILSLFPLTLKAISNS